MAKQVSVYDHEAKGYLANDGERPKYLFYFYWGFDDNGAPVLYRVGQFSGDVSPMPVPAWMTFL